ncbi:hypothetical protein [Oribacterium sp. NK2B42]|uniref:hypothetical protein n=1 Tax=Oribacterium sp. NK2B42 TaxID=689781 RepID=UPI000492D030|nr:hypothetical protein [Oribacterium sp. NK2B42]
MDPSLKWTIIGALGSWAGAIMGVAAILVAIKAYIQPMRIKLKASISNGIMTVAGITFQAYTVSLSNIGMRTVTIDSIMLSTSKKNYFLSALEMNTALAVYQPEFPIKLEQGAKTDMYFQKYKLDSQLAYLFIKNSEDATETVMININIAGEKDLKVKTSFKVGDFIRMKDWKPETKLPEIL